MEKNSILPLYIQGNILFNKKQEYLELQSKKFETQKNIQYPDTQYRNLTTQIRESKLSIDEKEYFAEKISQIYPLQNQIKRRLTSILQIEEGKIYITA